MTTDQLSQFIRQVTAPLYQRMMAAQKELLTLRKEISSRPRTITEEIDSIPGRRIFYTLNGHQTFDITQLRTRGEAITMQVSQDGPFIQTHYPVVMWLPDGPADADNLGQWSPVSSWPLPTQQSGTTQDRIDISYELYDGGSQRAFQLEPQPPAFLSRPDSFIPLPVPTLWTSSSVIQFIPTYENIFFAVFESGTETTDGKLVVGLPGYRIVNL